MKAKSLLIAASMFGYVCMNAGNPFEKGILLGTPETKSKEISSLTTSTSKPFGKKKSGGDAFEEGAMVVTVGYGFPNLTKMIFKLYQNEIGYKVSGFGPAHAKFEYGLSDKIGVGVSMGLVTSKVSWTYEETTYDPVTGYANGTATYEEGFKGSSFVVLARMNYHFGTTDKLDPYWGFGAGYNANGFKYYNTNPNSIEDIKLAGLPIGFESTVGMRYYFTDNIGAYMELGWGKSLLQAGLAAKF